MHATGEAAPLQQSRVPRHVAIIMDGNGRWAERRHLPRFAGHKAGVDALQATVEAAGQRGIGVLTVFAFSSENWRRPEEEVGLLMGLFLTALEQRVQELHERDVRVRLVGERSAFSPKLQERIEEAERLTRGNGGLQLVIAANYGGRWDVVQAARRVAREVHAGLLTPDQVDTGVFAAHLCLHGLPEPDLFIRTGGDRRISNFLLWDLAYTELHFTDTLWPDFDAAALDEAVASFAARQRRFGKTSQQVVQGESGQG